ncbi:hypothetical protein L6R49_24805 [Myxococcota bacterium]|nr:hypothetical protein [Myxococcota bacterium]
MKFIVPTTDHERHLRLFQGGTVKVWMFHVSLRRLALRVQLNDEPRALYIVCPGCVHIHVPFVWREASLSVSNSVDEETQQGVVEVADHGAGFKLQCDSVAMALGAVNELDLSFEGFLDASSPDE